MNVKTKEFDPKYKNKLKTLGVTNEEVYRNKPDYYESKRYDPKAKDPSFKQPQMYDRSPQYTPPRDAKLKDQRYAEGDSIR
jgi:hypothetical protein